MQLDKAKLKEVFKYIKEFISAFVDKELTLFAASLSFYTIFSIIPLLLIMMTLLTSLPSFEEYYVHIKEFIFSNLMPVNSETMITYIDGFLKNSAKMGVMSLVMVLVASLLFFKNFEYIANKIFDAQPRSLWESITTYWTMLTLTPIALGVSFYMSARLASVVESNVYTFGYSVAELIPYIITWGLFFLIYQISANTKIDKKATALASFVVAIIFSLSKSGFVYYVFYNKAYATIYGSFSILLFLFLWIYLSWIIFIYGLKLCSMLDSYYKENQKETPKKA